MLLLGLAASVAWGGADFLAGRASRAAAALTIALWSRGGALVLLVVVWALVGSLPAGRSLAWAAAAGAGSPLALLFLYRALALGPMSLVAPLSACGAAVPAIVAAALGHLPGPVGCAGLVVAFAGALLVSRPAREPSGAAVAVVAGGPAGGLTADGRAGMSRASLLAALGAAAGIGWVLTCLQRAADGAALSTTVGIALVQTTVTVALLTVVANVRGLASRPRGGFRFVVLAGVLDVTANVLFAAGSARANPAAVAVLGSLYPVATAALARVVLGERVGPLQAAGIGLAVAGVALIGVGA